MSTLPRAVIEVLNLYPVSVWGCEQRAVHAELWTVARRFLVRDTLGSEITMPIIDLIRDDGDSDRRLVRRSSGNAAYADERRLRQAENATRTLINDQVEVKHVREEVGAGLKIVGVGEDDGLVY